MSFVGCRSSKIQTGPHRVNLRLWHVECTGKHRKCTNTPQCTYLLWFGIMKCAIHIVDSTEHIFKKGQEKLLKLVSIDTLLLIYRSVIPVFVHIFSIENAVLLMVGNYNSKIFYRKNDE